jgi:hypothetical protein
VLRFVFGLHMEIIGERAVVINQTIKLNLKCRSADMSCFRFSDWSQEGIISKNQE